MSQEEFGTGGVENKPDIEMNEEQLQEALNATVVKRADSYLEFEELRKKKEYEAHNMSEKDFSELEHRMNILWASIQECRQLEAFYKEKLGIVEEEE